MNGEEQIRAEIQKLDVVTAPRVTAKLKELLSIWPAASSLFEPRIELVVSIINEQQKAARKKWLQA